LSFCPSHLPAIALAQARRAGGGSTKTQYRLKAANENQTYRFPLKVYPPFVWRAYFGRIPQGKLWEESNGHKFKNIADGP